MLIWGRKVEQINLWLFGVETTRQNLKVTRIPNILKCLLWDPRGTTDLLFYVVGLTTIQVEMMNFRAYLMYDNAGKAKSFQ